MYSPRLTSYNLSGRGLLFLFKRRGRFIIRKVRVEVGVAVFEQGAVAFLREAVIGERHPALVSGAFEVIKPDEGVEHYPVAFSARSQPQIHVATVQLKSLLKAA